VTRTVLLGAVVAGLGIAAIFCSTPGLRRAARPGLERLGLLRPYQETPRYRLILKRHQQENAGLSGECALLLGDSLTEGFPAVLTEPRGWVVRGISGDRARHVRARLEPSALSAPCTAVAVLVGSNDLVLDAADPAAVAGEIASLAEALQSAGKRVVLMTLPPTRGRRAEANTRIRALNARIEQLEGCGLRVVDLHRALVDDAGELDVRYSRDGLHLTPAAYARWAQLLGEGLGDSLPKLGCLR
jgi:lysophospholipase L1-like esterase